MTRPGYNIESPAATRDLRRFLWPRGTNLLRFAQALSIWAFFVAATCSASAADVPVTAGEEVHLRIEGTVEVARSGSAEWVPATDNQLLRAGDRVRTGKGSRALLESTTLGRFRIRESSEFIFRPPATDGSRPWMNLIKGFFYFFNREASVEVQFQGRLASATTRGTDFLVSVDPVQRVEVTVLDGEVDVKNSEGIVTIAAGEAGEVTAGAAPRRLPGRINAVNKVQWCLYYPVVVWPGDLGLSPADQSALKESLEAYDSGDLQSALASYPADRDPTGPEAAYLAALVLASGEVPRAEALLVRVETNSPPARALERLIAAVQGRRTAAPTSPETASEWLADSYYLQSLASKDASSLESALAAARAATTNAPDFGATWARVAELEFSFGRISAASDAVQRALLLSPRSAEAFANKGFLLAAQNRISAAEEAFKEAIQIDPGLANAWLGRGLARFRRGDEQGGVADMVTAAALEPQRALLRSYLAKGLAERGSYRRAEHELVLSRQLDPADPTALLYSAVLKQEQNRINEAIADLEQATALNDNRQLFRSRLLLDQDRGVSSVNLASVYRDAGLSDVSVREAVRAQSFDLANPSAHLFVADSYAELRDPTRFNLRYETVWFNEYLLANLLSPVGGGRLSQHISQQEYSKLFESDSAGLASALQLRSDGEIRELASQYGTVRNSSWSVDLDYQHNDGTRPNNELDRFELYAAFKQQLTPADSVLMLLKYQDYSSGDNFQHVDPGNARPYYRFDEAQRPVVLAGLHHEWSPGLHTLALAGLLQNEQDISDRGAPQLLLLEDPLGNLEGTDSAPLDVRYHNELQIFIAELNQLFQQEFWSLVAGGRYQVGDFDTQALFQNPPPGMEPLFQDPVSRTEIDEPFERASGYAYLTIRPYSQLMLLGGVSFDYVQVPSNFRNPPLSPGTESRSKLNPKAAAIWSPSGVLTVRGAYAHSLGGASLDESYRLEPAQLAGFPQAFRTVISESLVGSVAAPEYETAGVALDLKPWAKTYGGIEARLVNSDVSRDIGVLTLQQSNVPFVNDSTSERLAYEERTLIVSISRLLGTMWSVGARYEFIRADLDRMLPEIRQLVSPLAVVSERSDLHHPMLFAVFNHSSGIFARGEVHWLHQENAGSTTAPDTEDLVTGTIFAGYRFAQRRVELSVGILNLADQDYRLHPLTVYSELPRERTFVGQMRLRF